MNEARKGRAGDVSEYERRSGGHLFRRIRRNYRFISIFNSGLILLGLGGAQMNARKDAIVCICSLSDENAANLTDYSLKETGDAGR